MLNIATTGRSFPQVLLTKFSGLMRPGRFTSQIVEQLDLLALDEKLRTILPLEYQDCYEDVQPVSMGSAALKYDSAGKVAWDEIWGSFCDLAMAGGPPHKGNLLEPASPDEIQAQPERYEAVVDEIRRGIRMVSDLVAVESSPNPGWVRVMCPTHVMAGWLARAIVMENVSVRISGNVVELPAGPHYRVEKEIKNIITVIAKTCHYYEGHLEPGQQRKIGKIFAGADAHSPLLQPSQPGDGVDHLHLRDLKARIAAKLVDSTGLRSTDGGYFGWLGLETASVRAAIWMMRALVVNNVLARREATSLYVPVNPIADPQGEIIWTAVATVYQLARARGVLGGQA